MKALEEDCDTTSRTPLRFSTPGTRITISIITQSVAAMWRPVAVSVYCERAFAVLTSSDVKHAATGLASAWLWEPFAAFRTVTLYLSARPSENLLSAVGFHEGTCGSNAWLVVTDDAGVFAGQVYVDLKANSAFLARNGTVR